jgi:pimeloyl-ACP methyl ester carboxylesterase
VSAAGTQIDLAAQAARYTTDCGTGEIVWRRWGTLQNTARPLVLLHGGSGSWTHWLRNIEALATAGHTLWVPDLPGFGDSALPPQGSDADALIEPLHAGLQQLLQGQACNLVGFSFGGMTAGMLLAAHPTLAARLVLVGAPAMGVVPQRQFDLKAWRHLPQPEQLDIHRYNLAALMLHDTTLIDGLALQLHVANVERDRMPRRRLSHTNILARSLAQVTCPVHAIYGQHDALYKSWIDQLAAAYAQAAPDFRGLTLIESAGHWVQFERPQAFHTALLAALAG